MEFIELARILQTKIAFLVAYLPSIALAGWFEAWVAKKVGDNTPEEFGFLTLNPFVHANPFGIVMLLLVNFGFGNRVPLNPYAISGRWRTLKIILLFFANVFMYFFLSLSALIVSVRFFGGFAIANHSQLSIFVNYAHWSTALGLIVQALLVLNLQLCIVYAILGLVNLLMYGMSDEGIYGFGQANWKLLVLSLLMWLVLFDPLTRTLGFILLRAEWILNHFFGLL